MLFELSLLVDLHQSHLFSGRPGANLKNIMRNTTLTYNWQISSFHISLHFDKHVSNR